MSIILIVAAALCRLPFRYHVHHLGGAVFLLLLILSVPIMIDLSNIDRLCKTCASVKVFVCIFAEVLSLRVEQQQSVKRCRVVRLFATS